MKITGQYSTDGELIPFVNPVEVVQIGDTLSDADGFIVAVRDGYGGDWVSPSLHLVGVKSKMEVFDDNAE